METETETNIKFACIKILLWECAQRFYIFINHFTFCVTDGYLPQQYIIMQTINSLHAVMLRDSSVAILNC